MQEMQLSQVSEMPFQVHLLQSVKNEWLFNYTMLNSLLLCSLSLYIQ